MVAAVELSDFSAFVGAGAVIAVASVGGAVKLLCGRFDKIEKHIADLSGVILGKMAVLELNNNQRHEENVQRLTRVETLVLHDGEDRRRKRPSSK